MTARPGAATRTRSRRARMTRALLLELLILCVVVTPPILLFAMPDNFTGYRLSLVGGPSMQPLLGTRANVLLLRRTTVFHRFDVAQIRNGSIHRVVALPGETFWVRRGQVCVAAPGVAAHCLREPYVGLANPTWNRAPQRLGPDAYAWAADNRTMRFVKIVHHRDLQAVLVLVIVAHGGRFH
jgi:hypothetical protein